MTIIVADQYTHITSNTTTQVVTGPAKLKKIVLNAAAGGTITIEDAAGSDTTPVVGIIASGTAAQTIDYDVVMGKGIKIVTAGSSDITVTWNI